MTTTARSRLLADTATMFRRNMVHARRYPSMTVSIIIMPIVLMLMFRYIFGGALHASTGGRGYIDYLAPGMMLMIPAYLVVGVAVMVASDMTKGIVNRFRTMSIAQSSILSGQVLGTLVQGLLGVTSMVLVSLLVGWRPHGGPVEWLAAYGLVMLAILALTWMGVAFGLVAETPESASNMPMPLIMLPFLGSGMVPTDTMPVGVRQFAEYQPFTPLTETLRGLLMGGPVAGHAVAAVIWCLGLGIFGYLWSMSTLRKKSA
ncbi:ABC transporter permease [Nocardia stercoris]|uniref:Transport permease protein n=1 Tax=Nocardia stercoris TaxID=2483361 RepID=A0A3M2LB63_9NOCA|nr:ABC transporter permease [Nocardia stercoris]RMI33980.1 ABC transporter permease [Nocardia stercoris]